MDIVKQLGGTLARTVATTAEMISDKDLRKKAQELITKEAGQRLRDIQHGVQSGAGQLGVRLQQGPRQIQAVLLRLQQRLEEQRLQASLQAERDAPVDVQVGPVLYEDAPQELRSRMWMALLNDPNLTGYLSEERVLEREKSMSGKARGSTAGSAGVPDSPSPASHRSTASHPASPFHNMSRSPFSDPEQPHGPSPGTPSGPSPRSLLSDNSPVGGAYQGAFAGDQPATPRAVLATTYGASFGRMDSEALGRVPSFGSQPATPRSLKRSLTSRISTRYSDVLEGSQQLEPVDPAPSLSDIVERNTLRLRVNSHEDLSRKIRAGSLAEMEPGSARSLFRSSLPLSSTATTPRAEWGGHRPPTPPPARSAGPGSEDGLRGGHSGWPDTPTSGHSTRLSPFAAASPLPPASPSVSGRQVTGGTGDARLSIESPGKLNIDEAARRAEAFDAQFSKGGMRVEDEAMQSRQGLTRQRSRSLPREAGPGSRDVGPTGRLSGKFMTRLPSNRSIERRDVLAGILSPGEDAAESQEWGRGEDFPGTPVDRRDVLAGLDFVEGREDGGADTQQDIFSRRTVSQGPHGKASGRTQYTFSRVKPAARSRRSEGDAQLGGLSPSPLRQRPGEGGTSPLGGPSPLKTVGRHRRKLSVDSLHGELTPRSVTSDVGPLDFSFAPSEGPARPRSSRAASPFTLLGTSRADLATPSTPGSVADSDPGHMSPRFILGGRASLGQDSVSSVPRGGGGDLLLDGGLDEWEMVQGASSLYVFSGSRLRPARLQGRRMNTDQRAETLRQRIMEAVWEVQWPINAEYAEGGRYNTLLQISIGQEDVDEVISRDIHRTFPEHPQFGFQQGQQALFRVLKAYSLHDLEVGYCQGMAFVAGVLLMYLPEEPAFKGLCRLMDPRAKGGCGLRDLYMPGLEGLKRYLRMFEWLMGRLLPQVKEQLEVFAALPVLYASQWFLTAYSCPFPSAFACRVIDIMLTEQRGDMLLRTGLAIIAHIKDQLSRLDDFEEIITYLKVEPLKWSPSRMRQVLNFAVSDFVQDDMIRAAQLAVDQGYEGTLSRRGSSLITAAEAAAAAAENQRKLEEAIQQLVEKEADSNPASVRAARPPRPPRPAFVAQPPSAADAGPVQAAAPGPLAGKEKEEMEAEYMAMVMSLDTLWTGQGRA